MGRGRRAEHHTTSRACSDEALVVGNASPAVVPHDSMTAVTVCAMPLDSSTLTGATSDAAGTVKYRYYSTLAACNDAGNTFASPGGTGAGEKTVAAGLVPNSDNATFNSAGTFYWRAWYSGDANNNATSSACADEALVVGKASPTIATQLSSSSITVGGTIHDSSTLTGATSDAAGTVKYRYYSTLA